MPDKDANNTAYFVELFRQCLPFLSTIFLSCWGGIVSYLQRIRLKHHKFSFIELCFDLSISSFAGLLTYFFCQYAKVGGEMSAILIAVSGHMGTRAIASFERMRDRIFGVTAGEDAAIDKETKP
jgi:hypothetical protein